MKSKLISDKPLTQLAKKKGILSWEAILTYVRQLPYGRNKDRTNLSLVLTEEKGTCSSKHALLKAIADENHLKDVQLLLGIYQMTETNTPGIGTTLTQNGLSFLPEAHCYLMVNQRRIDLTSESSDITRIQSDILEETDIKPEQVGNFKVEYHKQFLKKWIHENKINFTFDEIWKIREACIANLANQT